MVEMIGSNRLPLECHSRGVMQAFKWHCRKFYSSTAIIDHNSAAFSSFIEEAAFIDGCNPVQTFFRIVFPVLRPTAITVAILNVMWLWNDYLLPLLALSSEYSTLPIAIQKNFTGSYGGLDMGGLMAMLVLTIIPIIIFYLFTQKYIIKGVIAGAVKG